MRWNRLVTVLWCLLYPVRLVGRVLLFFYPRGYRWLIEGQMTRLSAQLEELQKRGLTPDRLHSALYELGKADEALRDGRYVDANRHLWQCEQQAIVAWNSFTHEAAVRRVAQLAKEGKIPVIHAYDVAVFPPSPQE